MLKNNQEQHLLLIEEKEKFYSFRLNASQYTLGRDGSNSIVLADETVSRRHALLIRCPIPGTNFYHYEIIDGDRDGVPSRNGILVNDKRCTCHRLSRGDVLRLGKNIKMSYFCVHLSSEELDTLFPHDMSMLNRQKHSMLAKLLGRNNMSKQTLKI